MCSSSLNPNNPGIQYEGKKKQTEFCANSYTNLSCRIQGFIEEGEQKWEHDELIAESHDSLHSWHDTLMFAKHSLTMVY